MRETKVEYEVETNETEVEVVYCDICGVGCTDTHEAVAMELCPNCRDEEQSLIPWEEYKRNYWDEKGERDDPPLQWDGMILMAIAAPLLLALVLSEIRSDRTAKYMLTAALGAILWTVGIIYISMTLV